MRCTTTLSALLLCAGLGLSQEPRSGQTGPLRPSGLRKVKSQDASQSGHPRRLVLRNGELVIDGETPEPKPAQPGVRPPRIADLQGEPPRRNGSAVKSHTRRVVVHNGETIVDEETVDGKRVRKPR